MSWAEFLTLAPGSDRIPVELFQILKDDAVESAALNIQYALNMQYAGSQQDTTERLHLRIARRDKKAFLSDQCKEIEDNNRRGKIRDLAKKIRDTKGTFHAKRS